VLPSELDGDVKRQASVLVAGLMVLVFAPAAQAVPVDLSLPTSESDRMVTIIRVERDYHPHPALPSMVSTLVSRYLAIRA